MVRYLVLLCLGALALFLPAGCSQGGVVEGEVCYKMVTGMQDRRYFIIIRNEPTGGAPAIVFSDSGTEPAIKACFPAEGHLTVDDEALERMESCYSQVSYLVTLHLISGNEYTYHQACRVERDLFNQLDVGERVRVDTEPSDVGPLITRIV